MYAEAGRRRDWQSFASGMRTKSLPLARAVADLAARQHGVVSIEQLLAIGLSRGTVKRWVADGRLHPVHRGVYAVGHARLSANGRFMAAVLACGEGAVLSHRSAAHLWNLKAGGTRIEVTAPASGRRAPDRVRLYRTRRLGSEDRTRIEGIPVTNLARTLIDLAGVVDRRRFERAFEEAERNRQLDVRASDSSACRRSPDAQGHEDGPFR